MRTIDTLQDLHALYGTPVPASLQKVATRLVPEYRRWVEASRFCILSTVGPEGTDASPRGDDGAVVRVADDRTLLMPDWHGNNRIDSLRNIVRDGRLSLMFMVPGSDNVVRVNGHGRLTADADLLDSFARDGKRPRTVLLVEIGEVYFQCARAILRARLWSGGDESAGLPTPGRMIAALTEGAQGGDSYDKAWVARARDTLW